MTNAGPRRSAARERRARAAGVELARAAEQLDRVWERAKGQAREAEASEEGSTARILEKD